MSTYGNLALKKQSNKHNYIAEKIYSNKLTLINNDDLDLYLDLLHQDREQNSYISLCKLKNKKIVNRWGIKTSEMNLLQKFIKEEDFYCSINEFFRADKCTNKYLKRLNAFMIDLDYYNIEEYKNLSAESIIYLLQEDLNFPEPSFYVDSGNGLCIYWLLEKTAATKKSKNYWKKVQKELINLFSEFGADVKVSDPTRVTRPISTVNSKTGREVKLILPEVVQRYEISDLANWFWGEKIDKPIVTQKAKKKAKKKSVLVSLKTIQTLHYNRKLDLEKLVELRENLEGCREQLLFIYRLQLSMMNMSNEEALQYTLNLNSKMKNSLSEEEVISATQSAETNAEIYLRLKDKYDKDICKMSLRDYLSVNGVYLYSNATIIKDLKITEIEQKYMKTLIGQTEKKYRKDIRNKDYYVENQEIIKSKYEKNKDLIKAKYEKNKDSIKVKYDEKRKAKGKLSRSEQNAIIRQKIKALLSEGLKQKAISIELNIGIATVKRHIKFIKNN